MRKRGHWATRIARKARKRAARRKLPKIEPLEKQEKDFFMGPENTPIPPPVIEPPTQTTIPRTRIIWWFGLGILFWAVVILMYNLFT